MCPSYVSEIEKQEEEIRSDLAVVMGSWMRDTGEDNQKIWSVEGSNAMHWKTLAQYDNIQDYKNRIQAKFHTFSESCTGLGPVVYKNHLYCQAFANRRKAIEIIKFDLDNDQIATRFTVATLGKRRGGVPYKGWAGIYLHSQILYDK